MCNVNVVVDPFAILSLITLVVYICVDDEKQRERMKRLTSIKDLVEQLVDGKEDGKG